MKAVQFNETKPASMHRLDPCRDKGYDATATVHRLDPCRDKLPRVKASTPKKATKKKATKKASAPVTAQGDKTAVAVTEQK